jgi:sugar phosphate permease
VANVSVVLVAAALFPLFFFGSIYMQEIKGFSPIESGAGFLPFTVSVLAGAGLAQRSLPRFGAKAVSVAGLVLAIAGFAYLSRVEPDGSYLGALVPGFVAVGFGLGNLWLPMTMAATGSVDAQRQGLASGLVNTSQQIGGALGLAALSTLASEHAASVLAGAADPTGPAARANASVEGFALAFAAGSVILAVAVLALGTWLRRDDVDVTEADPANVGVPAAEAARA